MKAWVLSIRRKSIRVVEPHAWVHFTSIKHVSANHLDRVSVQGYVGISDSLNDEGDKPPKLLVGATVVQLSAATTQCPTHVDTAGRPRLRLCYSFHDTVYADSAGVIGVW